MGTEHTFRYNTYTKGSLKIDANILGYHHFREVRGQGPARQDHQV